MRLLPLLVILILAGGAGGPAPAQAPAEAPAAPSPEAVARWEELNEGVMAAYAAGDYARGVALAEAALAEAAFGERHPDTLVSLNNLAGFYARQGRYGEAEPLYERALELSREVLGERHPQTLGTYLNAVGNKAALGQAAAAPRLLAEMEGPLLTWLGAEIYATESTAVARSLVASQQTFRDVALSLAIAHPDEPQAQQVAASALLRFKGLQAEEEAVIARLVRRGRDDEAGALAAEIGLLRDRLARTYHSGAGAEDAGPVAALTRDLDRAERALGRLSRDYRDQLRVREANLPDLQGALAGGATLVEFSVYRPLELQRMGLGPARWGAVVVQDYDRVQAVDLGPVSGTAALIAAVVGGTDEADAASLTLYDRLIAPLGLDPEGEVLLAPDDRLHLVPFHRLMPKPGRHWVEDRDLRVLQTGRDLLRAPHDDPAVGLLALGAVDFGAAADGSASVPDAVPAALADPLDRARGAMTEAFRGGFEPLPSSGREVDAMEELYRLYRPAEATEVWRAEEATEDRLLALDRPPRVLHLATHGFYRPPQGPADRPMLLAGVALAGANRALGDEAADGGLYALEAQGMNLEGTELVVLSACETAQGVIGHGEGVYGLVRALRTAGARHALVTLRPVGDESAAAFMETFYERWLSQPAGRSDPARALRETQRHYIETDPDFD